MNYVGGLETLDFIVDGYDATELASAYDVVSTRIRGVDYLYVSAPNDDGIQVLSINAQGQISAVQAVPYSASNLLDSPQGLTIVEFGGESYLVSASYQGDALSVFRIDNDNTGTNGHLQLTDVISSNNITGYSNALDYVSQVASYSFGDHAYIAAISNYGDAISTYEVDTNGDIDLVDVIFDSDATALRLDGVSDVEAFQIGQNRYFFTVSGGDDGVSVFKLQNDGNLNNVFNIATPRDYAFILPMTYNGENLLIAAGSGYLGVYRIANDGSLTFLSETEDGAASSNYPQELELLVVEGVPFFIAGDYYDGYGIYALDDDYKVVEVQDISGTSNYDDVDGTNVIKIGSRVFIASAASDSGRLVITEVGAGSEYLIGDETDDRIVGMNGDDEILGRDGADSLLGGNGEDVLLGGHGSDTMIGGADDDILVGGLGADVAIGGEGADIMVGGLGVDELNYSDSAQAVTINLTTGAASGGDAEGDYYRGFENIVGSDRNDKLTGDNGGNKILGEKGADRVYGEGGADTLRGGAGWDSIEGGAGGDRIEGNGGNDRLHGDEGHDRIFGNGGADKLFGDEGNDILNGGGGSDTLDGGAGNDKMIGGNGRDTFVFADGFGDDTVTGFQTGAGGDILDFSEIDEINSLNDFKQHSFVVAGTTIVTFDSGTQSIALEGVNENAFTNDNFLF